MDGKVEGPIQGGEVVLKSQAHVVGDIHHQSLAIERGAYFDGRLAVFSLSASMKMRSNSPLPSAARSGKVSSAGPMRSSTSAARPARSRLVSVKS